MERHVARDLCEFALLELRPLLQRLLSNGMSLNSQKLFIRHIRDKLHHACSLFEKSEASVLHEDLYLLLFEAMFNLNEAIRLPLLSDEPVSLALDKLNELHDLLHAGVHS